MGKMSLKSNAILNTVKTVVGLIFPLITFPYISRVLQVESIGIYNFSSSVISYFLLIAGLGVAVYGVREGARYRDDKEKISGFISEVFTINMWSTIFSYICLIITVVCVSKLHEYSLAIGILSLEIFFTTIGVSWVCNIFEDFLFITIQSISVQVISLLLTLLFVKSPDDIYIYIAIVAFSKMISGIVSFVYVQAKCCHFRWLISCDLRKHIKPIMIIFSTSIAMTVYVSSDMTMLGFMTNDYQVGLYSTAVKIYTIVKNILAAALVVLVPRFSIFFENKDEKANTLFTNAFNAMVVIVFPAVAGLALTSQDVVRLIGGEKYLGGVASLQLLCLAIAFSLFATLYTQCILIPLKKEKMVFIATLISAIVNFSLNFVFIPWLGINGAAITTIIAEVLVCAIAVICSRGCVKLGKCIRNFVSVVVGCVLFVLAGIFIKNSISIYYIRLPVTVILSCIIYLLVLIVTKNEFLYSVLSRMKRK